MRTIRARFVSGFALIFSVMLLVLNVIVGIFLQNNNDDTIEKELSSFRSHSSVYVRQAFLINGKNNDADSFRSLSEEIALDLRAAVGADVAAYDVNGKLLSASNADRFTSTDYEDLQNAQKDILSFTILAQKDTLDVFFSFPVVVASEKVGILRVRKSYLDLYAQADGIRNLILIVSVCMFFVAFVFLTLLSNNISRPILSLARATNRVASGRRVLLKQSNRKDEIGMLIDNYNVMVKRIERQIRIIERDRDELEKLNSHRKDFYDQLTHELKTPLTTIMGYAEVIQQNGFTDKAFFEMGMEYIISESKRMDDMVKNLLEYSKGISHIADKPAPVCLSELCMRTTEEMQIKAGRYSCECVAEVEDDLYVFGIETSLKRLLLNLIDNAIKYGDSGEWIFIRMVQERGRARLTVENKGKTLSQEELHKLFIPFYQSNPNEITEVGSAGLGLAIVKSIVDEHHGQVSIDSKKGLTVVTVWLDLIKGGEASNEM